MTTTARRADAQRGELQERRAFGALVFAVVAPATYMLMRLYELARHGRSDVSLIIASNHVGYFWRVSIAAWFALTCALIAIRARGPRHAGRRL